MNTRTAAAIIYAALLAGLIIPQSVSAYAFVPTELEWMAWPQYCKARYVTTDIGERQKWSKDLSRAAIETQRSLIGPPSFIHVHHYCAGLAWMMRARLEGNADRRKLLLGSANSEVSYTFERIPKTSPIYATVSISLAQIYKDLGKSEDAIEYIQQAIDANPADYRPYVGLALLYRDMKRLDMARDTLLTGDKESGGQSSEIHYNLGLLYFELKEMDNAVAYAKKAYEEQYPLPGLQEKLKRAGHWPTD